MSQPTQKEEWRPVPDWESLYSVSNYGQVRSHDRSIRCRGGKTRDIKGRQLKLKPDRDGYRIVELCRYGKCTTKKVHQLVMSAFLGPRPNGKVVRHIDGNPENNWVENLRYGTNLQNSADQRRHGTHGNTVKTHCPNGHPLVSPNLIAALARRNTRACLACDRARGAIRRHPERKENFQSIADWKYEALMK